MLFDRSEDTKDPRAVKWSVLATWDDLRVIDYFKTVKGQNERYARNSLRFLRQKYGNGRPDPAPAPAPTPSAPYAPGRGATPAPVETSLIIDLDELAALLASKFGAEIAGNTLESLQRYTDKELSRMQDELRAEIAGNKPVRIEIATSAGAHRTIDGVHHAMAPKVIKLAGQNLNVMMVGPAGCGKTVLASSVARAFERPLTVISCSAGMSEAQLLGRLLPLGAGGAFQYVESPFVKAFMGGGVILLDEIDASDANLFLVVNAALANGAVEIEARAASALPTLVTRHPQTIVLAAANTWGSGADTQYMGRGALDASTLDRFYRLAVDYDPVLERLLGAQATVDCVHSIREKARNAKLRRVVSTRMITRIDAAMRAGLTFEEARDDELRAWTSDERSKVR